MKCARRILLLANIAVLTSTDEHLIVRIKQGEIWGTPSTDRSYDKFEGIPYAAPPLGERRFKAPAPPARWQGIFYANRTDIQCPQIDPYTNKVVGREDCLVLNVYRQRPREVTPKKQSVMVFIHGGGFITGYGGMYEAEFLVKHGVVVVTINYRLTSLGFLCFNTEDIPGNAGLKDQLAALRWIKKYISAFGGDTNSITIFGESAGAVSVGLHTLTIDSSEGLFHKAIAQSGSTFAEWAVDQCPHARVYGVAKILGASTCDEYALALFYQNVDFVKLIQASQQYDAVNYLTSPTYVCIEDTSETAEPYLTNYPEILIKHGAKSPVPTVTGLNDGEGIIAFYLRDRNDNFNRLDQNFSQYLPRDLCFQSEETKTTVAKIVRQFYFGDEKISVNMIEQFVDYFTDTFFLVSTVRFLEAQIRISDTPTYFYEFCYEGQRNLKLYLGYVGKKAAHGDELPYLFNLTGFPPLKPLSAEDQIMIDRMTTMWTNFAKYGNPIPEKTSLLPLEWTPVSSDSLDTLIINLNMSTLKRPLHHRIAFWDTIYNNYHCDD